MTWDEVSPAEVLTIGSAGSRLAGRSWLVRWDKVEGDIEDLVLAALPPYLDLATSGSTGPSRVWRRTREQLWAEAGLLAELLRPRRPQAVLSFVPPRHLFGVLATVLVPARLGVPVWYRPDLFGPMPRDRQRWAVMAIPWVFSLLLRQIDWVRSMERVDVLHSTAMVPAAAADFQLAAARQSSIVEVFGSTETGGIAAREWTQDDPPWEVFDDVTLDFGGEGFGESIVEAVPLVVRGPRLAAEVPGPAMTVWETGDLVRPAGGRGFRLAGRRSRLVKVNGRRMNLDELERSLRTVISCADLAIIPVPDAMTGEHIELLVVPLPGAVGVDIHTVSVHLGVRPRRVRVLDRIDRTETGKLRHTGADR